MDPKDVSDEGEVEEMMWSIKATDFLVEASSEAVGNGEIASNRKCARADKQANMQQPLDELSDTDGKIGYAYDTKSVKEKNKKPGANTPCKTENKEGLIDNRVGVPDMLNVTPQVWQTLQEEATTCWRDCLENNRSDPVPYFRKLSETFRCAPLGPRSDVDLVLSQLMKDIKREIVIVDHERYIAGTQFDALHEKLSALISKGVNDSVDVRALDHRVQRVLRACSRTVSGFDSYHILATLMENCEPKCLVAPGSMNNCPITIESSDGGLRIESTNVFKLLSEVRGGAVLTVLAVRMLLTEQISYQDWFSTRWIRLEPYDRIEDSLSTICKFRDNLKQQLDFHKYKFDDSGEALSQIINEFDEAIKVSFLSVKRLAREEFLRGQSEITNLDSKCSEMTNIQLDDVTADENLRNPEPAINKLSSAQKTFSSFFWRSM